MTEEIKDLLDVKGYVGEYVTHKLFDIALIGLKNATKRINHRKNILKLTHLSVDDSIEFIAQHIEEEIKWALNISFRDAVKAKILTDVFVDIDLYISPIKLRIDQKEEIDQIKSSEILSNNLQNIVLLGQPGAGKTTTSKKIFIDLVNKETETYKTFNFPIVVRLKELNSLKNVSDYVLLETILGKMGVRIESLMSDEDGESRIFEHIFKDFIERLSVLLIIDGYDELASMKLKKIVLENLRLLSSYITNSKFILTSRSADFDAHIEGAREFEICPLSSSQIKEFIIKWMDTELKAMALHEQLQQSPYWDTAIKPLTLAHLCALFERNNSIPDQPKSIYQKIITLLLEDWSNQRSIQRISKYATFTPERKMDYLSRFSYELTTLYNDSRFDNILLEEIYNSICSEFDLPLKESKTVVKEIESHSGLIIQTGNTSYEFAHKSLQEYLCADFITRLPYQFDVPETIVLIPNEMAISISISTDANVCLLILLMKHYSILEDDNFVKPFLSRLIIEKPNFKPNALLFVSWMIVLNDISNNIFKLEERIALIDDSLEDFVYNELDSEKDQLNNEKSSFEERIDYFTQSIDVLEAIVNSEIFVKSRRDAKNYYTLSSIEINEISTFRHLKKLGKLVFYKRNGKPFKMQRSVIDLPNQFIVPSLFYKEPESVMDRK